MAKKYVPNTLDDFIFESQYSIDEGIFDKAHLKKAGETLRKGAGWFEPSLLSVQLSDFQIITPDGVILPEYDPKPINYNY